MMHCLVCRYESIETRDFIALEFALDKKVCKNCAFALGRKAKDELLEGVKVHPPDAPARGILPVEIKRFNEPEGTP